MKRLPEFAYQNITQAVELIVAAFKNVGRLFYVGAGTSGWPRFDGGRCPRRFESRSRRRRVILSRRPPDEKMSRGRIF
jgi:N-acetylmuramic acid 6-phosphate (MurNAc-6-P) etherase